MPMARSQVLREFENLSGVKAKLLLPEYTPEAPPGG